MSRFTLRYLILGAAVFVGGAFFYWLFRNEQMPLVSSCVSNTQWNCMISIFFMSSFPSFVHVYAMSALTYSLCSAAKYSRFQVAFFWFGTNVVYEILSPGWLATQFSELQFHGDTKDVIAALIGAITFMFTSVKIDKLNFRKT